MQEKLRKLLGALNTAKSEFKVEKMKILSYLSNHQKFVFSKISVMISRLISSSQKLRFAESENMILRRKISEIKSVEHNFLKMNEDPNIFMPVD